MIKNLLLLILILIFNGCESQVGSAISGTFRNIISGKAFKGSSGDKAYNLLKEEYLKKSISTSMKVSCTPMDSIEPLLGIDAKFMSDVKDKLCSCKAWGTCDYQSCECGVLCPKDFGIFKKMGPYDFDSEANTLSFYNSDNKFKNDPSFKGYCWGISLITQKFNRLATFTGGEKKFDGIEFETQRLNEYKNIIDRINNNEPVSIPGFFSLNDFSTDPEVKNLLEDSSKEEWKKNSLTTQGLEMVSGVTTPSKKEMEAMFDDIEFRLKNNMSPAIVYNEKQKKINAHVVLISGSGVNPQTNERHLCLRDNNYIPDISMGCYIKMVLKKDGKVIRQMGFPNQVTPAEETYEIGKVALTHSENSSTIEQVSNLHAKCNTEKGCTKI